MIPQRTQDTTYERPRYGLLKAIEKVKADVPVEAVAAEYTELRHLGEQHVGRCPLPDHEDKTPSFVVYPDGGWRCFGCGMHGDVIDLEELCGRHIEVWTAVIALSVRYGVELPQRPEKWKKWTTEKERRRRALYEVRVRSYQRRFFRFYKDSLATIEDSAERKAEARRIWDDLGFLARQCASWVEEER